MANQQVDLTPNNPTMLHVHVPNGQSAAVVTNPTEAPIIPATSSAAKTVTAKIAQVNGGPRFQNPS